MMKVYLVRHGNAIAGDDDVVRPLSREGVEEVTRVARFLKEYSCDVENIYHSIRVRARQTAEIIHEKLKVKKPLIEKQGLSPNDRIEKTADFLEHQKEDVMLVGHMPFMGSLLSLLVSGETNRNLVAFPTGGVAILEKKHGAWLIASVINPDNL